MILVLGLTRQTGVRLAEIGYLFIILAGVWLVIGQVPRFKLGSTRMVVAGVALAIAGVLLIVATHWGYFGTI